METMKAIASRQSCRAYTGEQITDEELQTILEAANAAPVGNGRYDTERLTVIQNPELLARLDAAGAAFFGNPESHPLYGAPTLILVSAAAQDNKLNPVVYSNAACVMENMAIAAADLGLGGVYIMGIIPMISKDKVLSDELRIPQGFMPVSAFAVGKAAIPLNVRELTVTRIITDYIR
jgi:nitroreductase